MSWLNDVRGAVVGTTLASMGMPEIGYAYYQGETNKKAQKDSEKRQFKYQVELNNMMNEYNTPANQMQRYIDAGMNPYMASVSSGTQGSAGSVTTSAPNLNYGEFANKYQATLNADMDLQLKDLQLASNKLSLDMLPTQLQSAIDLSKAEARLKNANAETIERDNAMMHYLGSNVSSSKDPWYAKLIGAYAGKSNPNDFNNYFDFHKKWGYYPSRIELDAGNNRAYFRGVPRR